MTHALLTNVDLPFKVYFRLMRGFILHSFTFTSGLSKHYELGSILGAPKIFSLDVAEISCRQCSDQWTEACQTYLVLASGKLVLQKAL